MPLTSESPLPVSQYPDDFETAFLHITDEIVANTDRCLMYCDREIVVDSVVIDCGLEDAACTAQLFSGTYPAHNQTAITGAGGFVARTPTSVPITGNNIVAAGRYLNVDINVTTGITDATVLVRYRTRRK